MEKVRNNISNFFIKKNEYTFYSCSLIMNP
uniref:Uncharacterized protein n=1 Tax=Rhizophora mucronata TaxID=61149 RepID=A0A2P2MG97_RHIMU